MYPEVRAAPQGQPFFCAPHKKSRVLPSHTDIRAARARIKTSVGLRRWCNAVAPATLCNKMKGFRIFCSEMGGENGTGMPFVRENEPRTVVTWPS